MQSASIELENIDQLGNNKLHKEIYNIRKFNDWHKIYDIAIDNPMLLLQKNKNGQTPLMLALAEIQRHDKAVSSAWYSPNFSVKEQVLHNFAVINPQALLILNSNGNSLLDLLKKGTKEDKEFAMKLIELNPKLDEKDKLDLELKEMQEGFTDIFGKSLGEEDKPLLQEEKSSLQSSRASNINQNITAQEHKKTISRDQKTERKRKEKGKQESSVDENQRNLNPLTSITIREKDQDGNTIIHQLIKSKKVAELKKFIEENTEILKATPIIDDFESVPAICLRNDRGENPLHMMLLDLDTWGDELIIQIAKLHPGMIHVEDKFGIIPFDLTQPKSNLEKAFIELDPLANNFGKARKIDIEEDNQNNKKEKEPAQEIRRRKGPDEGKLITVNQSLPVFQPKQNSLPKYAAYGGLIGAGLGAGGMLIAIGIGCAIAGSLVFPPLGLALAVIGACTAIGLATGATYSKKDVIANKLATVFHKGTADNKTFIMEPDTHLKNV